MTTKELAHDFIINYVNRRLAPSTARGYKTNIRLYILPLLGERDVTTLTVFNLDDITETYKDDVSGTTLLYVHATFRKMLNYAVKRGYIVKNPYCMFDLPRKNKYKYRTLSIQERADLLRLCRCTPLEAPVFLALKYGLRRGEVLGLKVEDIDTDSCIMHVQRSRGTENGKEVLTDCKTKDSDRYILLESLDARMLYFKGLGQPYVVNMSPAMLDKRYKAFLRSHGLPDIRFHDLRHSYATYMLSRGVNPKIVSSVLGHSDVGITLDLYSHPDVSMQSVCLEANRI